MTIWLFTVLFMVALMLLAMVRLNTLVVAAMIVLGVVFHQFIFIDVAIIYALLSFVGTLYIAKYLGGEL